MDNQINFDVFKKKCPHHIDNYKKKYGVSEKHTDCFNLRNIHIECQIEKCPVTFEQYCRVMNTKQQSKNYRRIRNE